MKWSPSKALKNSVIVFVVVFLSSAAIQAGIPNVADIYRALIASGLAALLSYQREEAARSTASSPVDSGSSSPKSGKAFLDLG